MRYISITVCMLIGLAVGVAQAQTAAIPAAPTAAPSATSATPSASATKSDDGAVRGTVDGEKVTCRTVTVTGSRLQRRTVCTSEATEQGSSDWAREQQAKGGLAASGNLNGGG